eukprot:m.29932 g.29932  ORF g.29932 m.29932 type:complete len:485 (+) comp9217_c0_seq6:223-1677(+)
MAGVQEHLTALGRMDDVLAPRASRPSYTLKLGGSDIVEVDVDVLMTTTPLHAQGKEGEHERRRGESGAHNTVHTSKHNGSFESPADCSSAHESTADEVAIAIPQVTAASDTNTEKQGEREGDWRLKLFGSHLLRNTHEAHVQEQQHVLVSQALNPQDYDYVAVFIGADYCPHCEQFTPAVVSAAERLAKDKRCKVVFMSNDRTDEAYTNSRRKTVGIDSVPYNLDKTRAVRELFDLKTIPALMILKNNTGDEPEVVTNARHHLVNDPTAKQFPWHSTMLSSDTDIAPAGRVNTDRMSLKDRLIISGKYGKWWHRGHHVNPAKPHTMYMDENVVGIRAGFLNVISWLAIVNFTSWAEPVVIYALLAIVAFEFSTSILFGLAPLSPLGVLATGLSYTLGQRPCWKPADPKRFAWSLGLLVAAMCFGIFVARDSIGPNYIIGMYVLVGMCNFLTWLEAVAGFCVGCFIYNKFLVPQFKLKKCEECEL